MWRRFARFRLYNSFQVPLSSALFSNLPIWDILEFRIDSLPPVCGRCTTYQCHVAEVRLSSVTREPIPLKAREKA
jgi:hypothetical protein